jgi:hypothetical protein
MDAAQGCPSNNLQRALATFAPASDTTNQLRVILLHKSNETLMA